MQQQQAEQQEALAAAAASPPAADDSAARAAEVAAAASEAAAAALRAENAELAASAQLGAQLAEAVAAAKAQAVAPPAAMAAADSPADSKAVEDELYARIAELEAADIELQASAGGGAATTEGDGGSAGAGAIVARNIAYCLPCCATHAAVQQPPASAHLECTMRTPFVHETSLTARWRAPCLQMRRRCSGRWITCDSPTRGWRASWRGRRPRPAALSLEKVDSDQTHASCVPSSASRVCML